MLKIICNEYHAKLEADIVLTDGDIYEILNGKQFEGRNYTVENLGDFVDKIVDIGYNEKDVIVHTFNPLVLNFLHDVVAIESVYYAHDNVLFRVFEHASMMEKLTILGVGEVICDTYINLLHLEKVST